MHLGTSLEQNTLAWGHFIVTDGLTADCIDDLSVVCEAMTGIDEVGFRDNAGAH